jgi:hypothetical protein
LIEAIWGWDAPTYAVNLLQKHVSGLRRAIEPDRAASGNPGAKTAETRQRQILKVVGQMHEGRP